MRQLSARLETTKNQLETLRKIKESEEYGGNSREASLNRTFELEKRQLQSDLKQFEAQYSHLDTLKRGVERENQRLQTTLANKEQDIQVHAFFETFFYFMFENKVKQVKELVKKILIVDKLFLVICYLL